MPLLAGGWYAGGWSGFVRLLRRVEVEFSSGEAPHERCVSEFRVTGGLIVGLTAGVEEFAGRQRPVRAWRWLAWPAPALNALQWMIA